MQSTPANLASGRVGAADVYGYGSDNKDFVQLGWIYGGGTGTTLMPYSASPRAFLGEEYLGQPGDEILQPILGLSPGSTHGFELRRVEDGNSPNYGKYYAFVDGVQRGITKIAHLRIAAPAVNGEVTTGCVPMRSQWANTGVPYANLQYFRPSTGAWYYWLQTSFFNDGGSCWYSVPYGNAGATDFAASDYNQPGCPFQ